MLAKWFVRSYVDCYYVLGLIRLVHSFVCTFFSCFNLVVFDRWMFVDPFHGLPCLAGMMHAYNYVYNYSEWMFDVSKGCII